MQWMATKRLLITNVHQANRRKVYSAIYRLNHFLRVAAVGLPIVVARPWLDVTSGAVAFSAVPRREEAAQPIGGRPFRPSHFDIAIRVDPAIKSMSGIASILGTPSPDDSGIRLLLSSQLTVDSLAIDGIPTTAERLGDVLFVPLLTKRDPVNLGSVVVRVKYHGTPSSNAFGFSDKDGHFSAASYGLPYRASGWWPSPGSTTMKADSSDVRITVPGRYVAVSNGLLKRRSQAGNGWVTYHWSERYPIYPDVVAVAVAEYASFADSVLLSDGHLLPLMFFVFPSDSAKARADFHVFPELIRYFEGVLGPYPFSREKYGVVEFDRASFREHQTIPSLGAKFISGDRKNEFVLAHELAHQWFGNSLSVRNWKDVWLNEGLATYAALMWLERDKGVGAYDAEIERMAKQPYKGSIRLNDSTNVSLMFTSTTFDKAALMIHALRARMGDRHFRDALRSYIAKNKYGLVSTDDFRAAMEVGCGESLEAFFHSWLDTDGTVPVFGSPAIPQCRLFG
jgi:aminopeptidase N